MTLLNSQTIDANTQNEPVPTRNRLIAIVGGSGSGKTRLAGQLQRALGSTAAQISLDDFYKDQSHLPPEQRAGVNFDHPAKIDWPLFVRVLHDCRAGSTTHVPRYDFVTHTRRRGSELAPSPLILVEGLWLLWPPSVRGLFDLKIFLDCPMQLRLERRLARDVNERGRTAESVRNQFWKSVAPMHQRFVVPQIQQADIVIKQPSEETDLRRLVETLQQLAPAAPSPKQQKILPTGQNEAACPAEVANAG